MDITVIRKNGSVEQIYFGKVTESIKTEINQINNMQINSDEWSYSNEFTEKSALELAEFLGVR